MIHQVASKKPLKVELKNAESKYKTPTDLEDPYLPALFVFQGMRGSGKTYACVQMCRHFEQKGYIQRTFLLCPTAGDNEKDQKETIYANLKTLKVEDICSNINQFEKALVQVQERVKVDWKVYEKYMDHKKAHEDSKKGKKLENEQIALLQEHQYNPPSKVEKPKRHMLILDDCQGSNVYTVARAGMLNHLSIKHRHVPVTICFLVQSWVGVPRTIRLNATQYLIFKTSDVMQLDQIYSAFANTVSRECFDSVYHEATKDDHGFLYIDVVPKEPWMQFRKGFNDFLIVNSGEIRNMKSNRLKRKQGATSETEEFKDEEEAEENSQLSVSKRKIR